MSTEKKKRRVERGVYRHHGAYWIRYACPHCGRVHRERTTAADAALAKSEYERRKYITKYNNFCLDKQRQASKQLRQQAQFQAQQAQQRTFESVAAEYLAWAQTAYPRSLAFRIAALKHLEQAFGSQPFTAVRREDVRRYVQQRLVAGAKPGTVNRERACLSHIYNWAIELGFVEGNPVTRIKPLQEERQQPRCLTEDQEFRLIATLPERYRPIAQFALCTGLRLGEVRAQLWQDVLWEQKKLRVSHPKSGRLDETIPLNDLALSILHGLERTPGSIFMVPVKFGRVFGQYAEQAGLEGVTFKVLRSTFCSRLAQYVPPAALKDLARHARIETTLAHYVSFSDDYLLSLVNKLPGASESGKGEDFDTLLHQPAMGEVK